MKKNIIFLHIPKNGGNTLHHILNRAYSKNDIFTIEVVDNKLNTNEFINLPFENRQKIKLLKGHLHYGIHKYLVGKSEYFTFLRKPDERIISYYYYVLSRPKHRLYGRIAKEKMSLYDFVTTINEKDVNNAQIRMISGIDESEDNMLEKALETIENHFLFVGLLEKYNESLILLKNTCNWKTPYYITKNKTKNKMPVSIVDKKTLEAINTLNRGDNNLYKIVEKNISEQICKLSKFELVKFNTINNIISVPLIYRTAKGIKHILS